MEIVISEWVHASGLRARVFQDEKNRYRAEVYHANWVRLFFSEYVEKEQTADNRLERLGFVPVKK